MASTKYSSLVGARGVSNDRVSSPSIDASTPGRKWPSSRRASRKPGKRCSSVSMAERTVGAGRSTFATPPDNRLRAVGIKTLATLRSGGSGAVGGAVVQCLEHAAGVHGNLAETLASGVSYGVRERRQWRDDDDFANATDAERVARIRHFDDDRLDGGYVEGRGHAVIEEAGVEQAALLVVDELFVECPADALGGAALHLTFDVARVDGGAGIDDRGVAQHGDLAGFRIDFHVGDVDRVRGTDAAGRDGRAADDRPAGLVQAGGQLLERDPFRGVAVKRKLASTVDHGVEFRP